MIKEVNYKNFQKEIDSNKLILVDFWHPECSYCIDMFSILEEIDLDYEDKINIYKMDLSDEENLKFASKYKIRSLPSFKIFKNGKIKSDFSGLINKYLIESEIERLII